MCNAPYSLQELKIINLAQLESRFASLLANGFQALTNILYLDLSKKKLFEARVDICQIQVRI